ncbi:probable glycosyltransferase At5g03795 isoform X1 [Aristolochia californica]|uniref:probable glycosyltransferase At5g03795 isoform X1 n=2 Tax=Aristolochia californica TaxID=171875 RepID=UPI0035DB9992
MSLVRSSLSLISLPVSTRNFVPTTLALLSSCFIVLYVSSTSSLFNHSHHPSYFILRPSSGSSSIARGKDQSLQPLAQSPPWNISAVPSSLEGGKSSLSVRVRVAEKDNGNSYLRRNGQRSENEVFHDKDLFLEDYKQMNKSFKIYIYPHRRDDPFANALLPVDFEPGGNYASESYFKKVLVQSHFLTNNPSKADLFFLPFSIARLRHDPRVDVGGIPDFIRNYISHIKQNFPYWNRTNGADHFYVACHSAGRSAMEKAEEVMVNAIQVVCSSSYFISAYVAHKDASLPQIWPRKGNPSGVDSLNRKKLAFFAGSMNSPVRLKLLKTWENDSEIFVHFGRLQTPYSDQLLGSKFCLHVKGFEVNTARIADSLYYGCVPIVIANHYDLPFQDILNWKSFSLVVPTLDIPLLKRILQQVSSEEYERLQRNVMKVRKHFMWNLFPVDYDAFYMVMYELWLRRNVVRIPLNSFSHLNPNYTNDSR